jgi:hypothetical protein
MKNNIIRAVAILARLQPLLITLTSEKEWYLNLLQANEKSEKNDFLIEKTQRHIEELQRNVCMIEDLLFPDCGEKPQDPEGILSFLERNEGIKKKLIEKIKESKDD